MDCEDEDLFVLEPPTPKSSNPPKPTKPLPELRETVSQRLAYDQPLILFSREIPPPQMPEHMVVKKRSMSEQIPTTGGMSILTFLKSKGGTRKRDK